MFHVLRHGETEWNRRGALQGRHDSPLTPLGRAQARAMGRCVARLAGGAPLELWSSPLGRAMATARIVAEVLGMAEEAIRRDDRLMEIDYGTWEGATHTEAALRDRAAYDRRYVDKLRNPVPGGESYGDAYTRALAWVRERDAARDHVVVGHGAFNRMLLAALTGLDPETLLDQADPQDAVMVIEGTRWRFEDAGPVGT